MGLLKSSYMLSYMDNTNSWRLEVFFELAFAKEAYQGQVAQGRLAYLCQVLESNEVEIGKT
jgi:hypothetical protein